MAQKRQTPYCKGDALIQLLNDNYGKTHDIRFSAASDEVVAGAELERTGNRSYGNNVYVSTGPRFDPGGQLTLGRTIAVGAQEHHARGILRCERDGQAVVIAVFAKDGRRISRRLRTAAGTAEVYDEGRFIWFGPVEIICTPWSDNDPSVCQVITVQRLRLFAANNKLRRT